MLKKSNLIEKRNVLNELRCNNMHLQELRFFTIYLSRINARDPKKTRCVRFGLSDFLAMMELKKINIEDLKNVTNRLLCKVVNIPSSDGGYEAFQLFKKCKVSKDKEDNTWYIEIDAHDDALPLMFDFKRDYFTYELWNALRLGSSNQLRMYEILKQYEKKGERRLTLEELKNLLFIGENEYSRFQNFKIKVLEACQEALKQNTDISFDYELIKQAKGKVSEIHFIIKKNTSFVDQLTLSEFIDMKSNAIQVQSEEVEATEEEKDENNGGSTINFFSEALKDEFTIEEVNVLYKLALPLIDGKKHKYNANISMFDYLSLKLTELNTKKNVKHRFNYLKKLIQIDVDAIT